MPNATLDDRGLLRVGGPDARALLQGVVTCDMDKVLGAQAAFGALLSPQGKILVDFIIHEVDDGFLLDCPGALAPDLARRLTLYRLRARVTIEDVSDALAVRAAWDDDQPTTAEWRLDPRDARLGSRAAVARGAGAAGGGAAAYEALRIKLGAPKGGADFIYGDTFPHEADMDELHGLDFRKGCYVGQEVVSRVEHRGLARKRVRRVAFAGEPPSQGAAIRAGEVEIGVMGSATQGLGLAMLRLDRVEAAQAAGAIIEAEGVALTLPGLA